MKACAPRSAPRQLSGRGVSYWTDGNGDDRIIYITTGYRLVELNAHTGQPIDSFGDHGMVDLKVGAYTGVMGQPGVYKQIDLTTGEIGLHSTPTVVDNTVLVGSSFKEGSQPLEQNNTKGLTRAFDAKTGKLIWTFHNIPQKGEFGYDSWKNNSADFNGNTGTWAGMTVDPDADTVYAADRRSHRRLLMAARRPGNDLFGDCLVALDLTTGKMKWYYQVAHHPIWDYDMSSPPLLVDITVDGKPVKAVAVPIQAGLPLYLRPHHRQADLADRGEAGAADRMCRARRPPRPSPSRPSRRLMRASRSPLTI